MFRSQVRGAGTFFEHEQSHFKITIMSSKNEAFENHGSDSSFLLGFLAGAALGVVAAILYAPKSGEETRGHLKDLADQQKQNLSNQWENTKGKAGEAVNAAREKLDAAAEQAKTVVDQVANRAKGTAEDLAESANQSVDRYQRRV